MAELLGNVIKEDRKLINITQLKLQRIVETLARSDNNWVAAKLISNIERGVARVVPMYELSLIGKALGQNPEKYYDLEVNPMNFVNINKVQEINENNNWFDRSIEFDPEYRQAGVSILSFFAEVVKTEYSDMNVRVGILQEDNKVTLRIETPEGEILKEVEKTLEKYGMVVMGSAPIDSLSDNKELIRDLKTRLEVTNLELRLRQESHIEQNKQYENRILNLESQVKQLHDMIGSNLAQHTRLTDIIKSIVADDRIAKSLNSALSTIDTLAKSEYSEMSAQMIKESINQIENKSPGFSKRLLRTIEAIPASIISTLASPWIQSILLSVPK